jgi:hypothetical protein
LRSDVNIGYIYSLYLGKIYFLYFISSLQIVYNAKFEKPCIILY